MSFWITTPNGNTGHINAPRDISDKTVNALAALLDHVGEQYAELEQQVATARILINDDAATKRIEAAVDGSLISGIVLWPMVLQMVKEGKAADEIIEQIENQDPRE